MLWKFSDKFQSTHSTTYDKINLRRSFNSLMDAISGQDIRLLKLFRHIWSNLDNKSYITGSNEASDDVRSPILGFPEHQLCVCRVCIAGVNDTVS